MTELKQIKFNSTEAWRDEFYALLEENNLAMKTFIVDAITEKVERDFNVQLQPASAPHGVRKDALPDSWMSRLYDDRYQLVAIIEDTGIELIPLHQYQGEIKSYAQHRVESPEKAEIYSDKDIPVRDIQLAYLEWLLHDAP